MTIYDLQPGDVIISHKAVRPHQLIQRFFDWRVRKYSTRVFGPECIFPEANHGRMVAGRDYNDSVWGFHSTTPTARFCRIEPWMIDPSYARVYRYIFCDGTMAEYMNECLKYEGSAYDVLQLFNCELGLGKWFDMGPHHHHCASVIHAIHKKILGLDVDIPIPATPPCMWANLPDLYDCLNYSDRTSTLRNEPEMCQ